MSSRDGTAPDWGARPRRRPALCCVGEPRGRLQRRTVPAMRCDLVSLRRWLGATSIIVAGTALAACSGDDGGPLTIVAQGGDAALATDPVPPTDPSPPVTSPPVPPPADVVLEVGPRQEVCAHEHAVAAPLV